MKSESNMNEQEDCSEEDDNITLLVKKFGKFLKKYKTIRFGEGKRFVKKKVT